MRSQEKIDALNQLLFHREKIEEHLKEIESILMTKFTDEYSVAYQHWIPQIKTALRENTKWLSRSDYSMDYTVNRITDKMIDTKDKGVFKFIN